MPKIIVSPSSQNSAIEFLYMPFYVNLHAHNECLTVVTKYCHWKLLRASLFEFACPQSLSHLHHKILPLNFCTCHFMWIYIPTISVQKNIVISKYTIQVYSCFFYTDIQLSWFVSGLVDFLVFLTNKTTFWKQYLISSSGEKLDSHLLTLVWKKELFSIFSRFVFCWARDDGQKYRPSSLPYNTPLSEMFIFVCGRAYCSTWSSISLDMYTLLAPSLHFAWREEFA